MKMMLPILLTVLLSSCSVGIIKKHRPHFKTTRTLSKSGQKMTVGKILDPRVVKIKDTKSKTKNAVASVLNRDHFKCRLTTIDLPKNMDIRAYVHAAITDEIDAANLLKKNASQLNVTIHEIESDTSSMSTGAWNLDFEYSLRKKNYRIKTKTEFESAFAAVTACRSTADTLTDAITENLLKFFSKL